MCTSSPSEIVPNFVPTTKPYQEQQSVFAALWMPRKALPGAASVTLRNIRYASCKLLILRESSTYKQEVAGSSPALPTIVFSSVSVM